MSLPREYRELLKPKSVDSDVSRLLNSADVLHTVCREAVCPNRGECFSKGTATFLIMGNVCTRNCGFCAVQSGKPDSIPADEIDELIHAVRKMQLKYTVLTSVTRDDLPDGGASYFNKAAGALKEQIPGILIEALVPDFRQNTEHLNAISVKNLDVFNHNLETVKRLYPAVRKSADYDFSLELLKRAKERGFITKTGIMTGVGETEDELKELFTHAADAGVSILTIGQYIRPGNENIEVDRYYTQREFDHLRQKALDAGIKSVLSGVFVRSSYKAHETYKGLVNND